MRVLTALAAGALFIFLVAAPPAAGQDSRVTSAFKPLSYPIDPQEFQNSLGPSEREIYQLIEDLLYVRLRRTLACDDRSMIALATATNRVKDQLTMLKWERAGLRENLRWCLDVGLPDAGLQPKLNMLLDYEEEIARLLSDMVHASEQPLGVAGSAKLYLFVDDFERFLSTRIAQAVEDTHAHISSDGQESADSEGDEAVDEQLEKFQNLVRAENRDVPLGGAVSSDVIKLVDALLIVRLTQAVNLTGDETVKLLSHIGAHKDQLHELKWQIGSGRAALRQAIESGAADDEIRKLRDDLLIQEHAVASLVKDLVDEAGQDLSAEQSVRLYLFLGDFEQYIVGLLERAQA